MHNTTGTLTVALQMLYAPVIYSLVLNSPVHNHFWLALESGWLTFINLAHVEVPVLLVYPGGSFEGAEASPPHNFFSSVKSAYFGAF